jgi:hypothetical protein
VTKCQTQWREYQQLNAKVIWCSKPTDAAERAFEAGWEAAIETLLDGDMALSTPVLPGPLE